MKTARNSAQFKLLYLSQALMSKAMGNEMEWKGFADVWADNHHNGPRWPAGDSKTSIQVLPSSPKSSRVPWPVPSRCLVYTYICSLYWHPVCITVFLPIESTSSQSLAPVFGGRYAQRRASYYPPAGCLAADSGKSRLEQSGHSPDRIKVINQYT
jgi:hypothetical protein